MTSSQKMPDFFIAGAAKSGTSSLYRYLGQHPDIYFPAIKEPNFLAYRDRPADLGGPLDTGRIRRLLHARTVWNEQDYRALFAGASRAQLCGDASPRYLYYATAPANMAQMNADARVILLLRNPVRRAHSHFRMNREFGLEPCRTFGAALSREPERMAAGYGWDWHYSNVSRYGRQLERLLGHFPREQLHVVTYERFVTDPAAVCAEIFRFLGVPDTVPIDVAARYKVSESAGGRIAAALNHSRHAPLVRFLKTLLPANVARPLKVRLVALLARRDQPGQQLDPAVYAALWRTLEDDVRKLEQLTAIDCSPWHRDAAAIIATVPTVARSGARAPREQLV